MATTIASQWAQFPQYPTIKDLRTKSCWICLEQETIDSRALGDLDEWVHPCSCSLVCHTQCLLTWMQTQENIPAERSKDSTLRCPQCLTQYYIQAHNPPLLRFFRSISRIASSGGQIITVVLLGSATAAIVTGGLTLLGLQGQLSLKQFIGEEAYWLAFESNGRDYDLKYWVDFVFVPIFLYRWESTWGIQLVIWGSSAFGASTLNDPEGWKTFPPNPFMTLLLWPFQRYFYRKLKQRIEKWITDHAAHSAKKTAVIHRQPATAGNHGEIPDGGRDVIDLPGGLIRVEFEQQDDNIQAPVRRAYTGATIGKRIFTALAIPAIAELMGKLLLRASLYSPLLRTFLGLGRPPRYAPVQIKLPGAQSLMLGMSKRWKWCDVDPVWWRNSVGLSLWVVAFDCSKLTYLWLSERERQSRQIVDRPFTKLDNLDLLPPP